VAKDDLLLYYKKIAVCRACKRKYGVDYIKDANQYCPICEQKDKDKLSIFTLGHDYRKVKVK